MGRAQGGVTAASAAGARRRSAPGAGATLQGVLDGIEQSGVECSASAGSQGGIVIHMIRTRAEQRGSGASGAALRALTEHADRAGETLALSPEPVAVPSERRGLSKTALVAWYRANGFVPNKGAAKDWRFRETMIRPPRV